MMNRLESRRSGRNLQSMVALFLATALCLATASGALAQKDKKQKKDAQSTSPAPAPQLPDQGQIDYMISEMLGAWQIGDIEKLRKDYADDVSIVSGAWAPPVIGWPGYLASYQQQRARIQQVRLDRTNTFIKVDGTLAWACYQWDFSAVVDGQPSAARGQTTLIMEKRNNHWVIVHNHTSLVETGQPSPPASTPPAAPAKPSTPA
jgi:ketosteroid isomerase-like protein